MTATLLDQLDGVALRLSLRLDADATAVDVAARIVAVNHATGGIDRVVRPAVTGTPADARLVASWLARLADEVAVLGGRCLVDNTEAERVMSDIRQVYEIHTPAPTPADPDSDVLFVDDRLLDLPLLDLARDLHSYGRLRRITVAPSGLGFSGVAYQTAGLIMIAHHLLDADNLPFVFAHELGHVLDPNTSTPATEERFADTLAVKLLEHQPATVAEAARLIADATCEVRPLSGWAAVGLPELARPTDLVGPVLWFERVFAAPNFAVSPIEDFSGTEQGAGSCLDRRAAYVQG